ncbi:hypothetical protein M8818_006849 [Zalaria obscura]|uniref:Uncharacterized protein n=1 Tax=Zalaria obscura TaxID=2024903 RepID=A0ACC3S671_9PEZI
MPFARPAALCLRTFRASAPSTISRRTISSTRSLRSAEGSHEEHYDPPGGWLFGVKPGEKYQNEGWENVWFYGFYGVLAFGVIGYCYKPDTSIQTWALEEARRRLEAEGILQDPGLKAGDAKAQTTDTPASTMTGMPDSSVLSPQSAVPNTNRQRPIITSSHNSISGAKPFEILQEILAAAGSQSFPRLNTQKPAQETEILPYTHPATDFDSSVLPSTQDAVWDGMSTTALDFGSSPDQVQDETYNHEPWTPEDIVSCIAHISNGTA